MKRIGTALNISLQLEDAGFSLGQLLLWILGGKK